jgi:hypothetical protein
MIYRIIQYIQPWEIDDLERQVNTMILSSYHINESKNIIWTVIMNTDIINWDDSKIKKDYFIDKLNYLNFIVNKYYIGDFKIDNKIKGCTDLRRLAKDYKQDYLIWLDSDLFFSYLTLPYLINASKVINEKAFMISPQIIKYWDDSWDILVHDKFIKESYLQRDTFDLNSLHELVLNNTCLIKSNIDIKFGGGWFNLFSKEFINAIPLPEELGSYSQDDTYYSLCGKKLGYKQYILDGVVVSEIGNSFLENKDYLKKQLIIKIKDKNKISNEQFYNIVKKFYESN